MTKLKVWCCHPVRHNGAKKIGRAPTHPRGKYLVSSDLDSFLREQYNVPITSTSQVNMSNLKYCTSCYEYELKRFERIQASVGDQQLSKNDDQSPMELLDMQGDFEISASQRSADDELTVLHDRQVDKDIINNVFRILEIEEIVDM